MRSSPTSSSSPSLWSNTTLFPFCGGSDDHTEDTVLFSLHDGDGDGDGAFWGFPGGRVSRSVAPEFCRG